MANLLYLPGEWLLYHFQPKLIEIKYRLAQNRMGRALVLYYADRWVHTDTCFRITRACEGDARVRV